jgi:hypothetical protein
VTAVCTPPSGSFFLAGTTIVTCVATDSNGNKGYCSFDVTVRDTAAPTLTIRRQGANVVILWPTGSACNYILEQTEELAAAPPSFWTPVAAPVVVMGGNYTVTVPIEDGNRFFRLRYP